MNIREFIDQLNDYANVYGEDTEVLILDAEILSFAEFTSDVYVTIVDGKYTITLAPIEEGETE